MRQEPPVSVPRPAAAMPSATATAVPEELPPGMRLDGAVPRAGGRAVMRVDAEAGEGELGHVDAADRDEAGGEHAGDDRGVGLSPAGASARTAEPAGVGSPAMSNRSFSAMGMPA